MRPSTCGGGASLSVAVPTPFLTITLCDHKDGLREILLLTYVLHHCGVLPSPTFLLGDVKLQPQTSPSGCYDVSFRKFRSGEKAANRMARIPGSARYLQQPATLNEAAS